MDINRYQEILRLTAVEKILAFFAINFKMQSKRWVLYKDVGRIKILYL